MNQDKVASLLGFTKRQLIIRRDTEHWIKSRKNAGMGLLGRMEEIDLARSIFKAWDVQERGYLTCTELNEYMITLGLATEAVFSHKLLSCIKAKKPKRRDPREPAEPQKTEIKKEHPLQIVEPYVNTELLTLKDFLKVFEFDKFGDKACALVLDAFNSKLDVQKMKL